jgi:8-oxo-dGTP diphosphatase
MPLLVHWSAKQKEFMARLVRAPIVSHLMGVAVRLLVPRQRVGVGLVGHDGQGRILMLRHVFHPRAPWGLPGGWLDRNEAPAAAALRELREETGLTAALGPVVYTSYESTPPHIGIAYLARINPAAMTLSSEIIEADWFNPDSLPDPLLPFVRRAITAALEHHCWLSLENETHE